MGEPDGKAPSGKDTESTARESTDNGLTVRDDQLRHIVEAVQQGIVVHRHFQPLYINPAFARLFGYETPADVWRLESLEPLIAETSLSLMQEYHKRRIKGESAPEMYVVEGRRRDGSPVWLTNRPVRVLWEGEPAICTTMVDISDQLRAEDALRQSEATFRSLVDQLPVGVFLKDVDGRYQIVNSTFQSWYQTSMEELRGKTVLDRYSGGTGLYLSELEHEVVTSKAINRNESESEFPDGQRRTTVVTRFPIIDGAGEVTGIGGFETDISERREWEQLLIRAKEDAEFANRAKSEFLANMSHELRTPLNSVIGFSQLMVGETFGPLGHDNYTTYAEAIQESGVHLLQIISDILDISKVEAGELGLSDEDLPIPTVMLACTQMIQERAGAGDVKVETDLPADLPHLRADEVRLKQILINLLTNAVKFTPAGGQVSASAFLGDDGGIVLRVVDTGVGIAAENMERVLKPFEQVREAAHQTHEGTGLGLYLTNSLVNLHGGRLTLESEPGKGTCACAYFPPERTVPNG